VTWFRPSALFAEYCFRPRLCENAEISAVRQEVCSVRTRCPKQCSGCLRDSEKANVPCHTTGFVNKEWRCTTKNFRAEFSHSLDPKRIFLIGNLERLFRVLYILVQRQMHLPAGEVELCSKRVSFISAAVTKEWCIPVREPSVIYCDAP
jgi:hypothetical protein